MDETSAPPKAATAPATAPAATQPPAGGGGDGGLWEKIQDKWYSLLDALDSKGVPVYSIVDPIENAGIPSLPVFVGMVVLLGVVAFMLLGQGGVDMALLVQADGQPLAGAQVAAFVGDSLVDSGETDSDGQAMLSLSPGTIRLELTREECEDKEVEIEVEESGEREIDMDCMGSVIFAGCVELPEELATTRIAGEDNSEPSNCRLRATTLGGQEVDTQWVIDSSNFLMFSTEKCVQEDYEVFIECDRHSRSARADELVEEALVNGEIVVYPTRATGLEAKTNYNVYVTVEDKGGQPIQNIRVLAIDSMGNDYITGYRNTRSSDTTNSEGSAVLKIAEGLEFLVRAEDPNGEYTPAVSSILKADDAMEVTLVMDEGLQSEITVVRANGGGIGGAPILIKQDGVIVVNTHAGTSGMKTVSLAPGSYTLSMTPTAAPDGGSADGEFLLALLPAG